MLSPRFDFAFNVFGTGKIAVRGGFGVYYARPYTVDQIAGPVKSPPAVYRSDLLEYDLRLAAPVAD